MQGSIVPIFFIEDRPNISVQLFFQLVNTALGYTVYEENKTRIDIHFIVATANKKVAAIQDARKAMKSKYEKARDYWCKNIKAEDYVLFSEKNFTFKDLRKLDYEQQQDTDRIVDDIFNVIPDNAVTLMDLILYEPTTKENWDLRRLEDKKPILSHLLCKRLQDSGRKLLLYTNYGAQSGVAEKWGDAYKQTYKNPNPPYIFFRDKIDGGSFTDDTFFKNILKDG